MTTFKVVAFDLDDTLWHVHPVIVRAEQILKNWLHEAAPQFSYDQLAMRSLRDNLLKEDSSLGHRLTELRRQTIERALLEQINHRADAERLSHEAMEVFLVARNDVEFFEGALEVIASIAEDYRLGALTNGNADIHRLGLSNHFSFAFSAEQVGAPKPAPDLFHKALEHTGCAPEEMIYVGDDPVKDVDAANRVGLKTIWVKGEARPLPGETNADVTIEDIRHLPNALEQLIRQV